MRQVANQSEDIHFERFVEIVDFALTIFLLDRRGEEAVNGKALSPLRHKPFIIVKKLGNRL
jgi:hypothetical protein